MASRCFWLLAVSSRDLRKACAGLPIVEQLLGRDGSIYQPRVWVSAGDDVRNALSVLCFVVWVIGHAPGRYSHAWWGRDLIAVVTVSL